MRFRSIWYFAAGIVFVVILVLTQSFSLENLIMVAVPLVMMIAFAVRILMRKDRNGNEDKG
jgi:uncharacterized membrane protein